MFDNLIFESEENIFKPRRIEDREDEVIVRSKVSQKV